MKNPLALPIVLLVASLVLLVVAILMTPEIEVVEDPNFDAIVTVSGTNRPAPPSGAPPEAESDGASDANASAAPIDPFVAAMLADEAARATGQ